MTNSKRARRGTSNAPDCSPPHWRLSSPELFQDGILSWFDRNKRQLPWRENYEPYHVWISEIMLQQTQMTRGVAFFERWMRRFPDIPSVAAAPEEEVLKLWEGLGYYSRARNIQKAARLLVARHGGQVPDDYEAVAALPGVGRYTAGAIMSFAFNRPCPAVDANVERLFSRLYDIDRPVKDREVSGFIWREAERLIPPGKARMFNQALMELGALICLPRSPRCPVCPVADLCGSRLAGTVAERPILAVKKRSESIHWVVGVLMHEGRVLIRKRPPDVLMPLLWELPGGVVEHGTDHRRSLERLFREELGLVVSTRDLLDKARHGFTRYSCAVSAYLCRLENADPPVPVSPLETRWVAMDELDSYAFNSGQRRIVDRLARDMRLSEGRDGARQAGPRDKAGVNEEKTR